jgi:hypothetical protein
VISREFSETRGATRVNTSQAKKSHGVPADEVPREANERIEQNEASGDGVLSKVPLKVPQTMQDNLPLDGDTKKADAENPVDNWGCLVSALGDSPSSCPTRT